MWPGGASRSSITAFQAKYLLRVFLRQFRDPAQALEELNAQMSSIERAEEFISVRDRGVRHRGPDHALRIGGPPGGLAVARAGSAAAAGPPAPC